MLEFFLSMNKSCFLSIKVKKVINLILSLNCMLMMLLITCRQARHDVVRRIGRSQLLQHGTVRQPVRNKPIRSLEFHRRTSHEKQDHQL